MPTESKERQRPASPLGRALDSVLQTVYRGNIRRFALTMGVARQTVYVWLYKPGPRVERPNHRQAIAYALGLDVQAVDTLIVVGHFRLILSSVPGAAATMSVIGWKHAPHWIGSVRLAAQRVNGMSSLPQPAV
jgi:hypothetical protein